MRKWKGQKKTWQDKSSGNLSSQIEEKKKHTETKARKKAEKNENEVTKKMERFCKSSLMYLISGVSV